MIRKLLNRDIDRVAYIWLKTNLKAHYFISKQYWKSNYELVKEMMLQSEVYVFEADKMIQGFVGLNDEYIEGIFVSDEMQSCGIGKLLLDYIKDKKVSLRLNVYQKNARAISFYQREGSLFNVKIWMKLLVKRVHHAMETKIEIGICEEKVNEKANETKK